MSNLNHITPGHLDRITGTLFTGAPHFDALETYRSAVADEQAQIVRERDATIIKTHEALWQANESFAILAKALPDDKRVAALFELLDEALKAYEVAAGEVLQ
jgi:hypothetical protein